MKSVQNLVKQRRRSFGGFELLEMDRVIAKIKRNIGKL